MVMELKYAREMDSKKNIITCLDMYKEPMVLQVDETSSDTAKYVVEYISEWSDIVTEVRRFVQDV